MFTYQIIILIVSLVAIGLGVKRYHEDNMSLSYFVAWILIWILIILFSIFPNISTNIASIFGFGRGLDTLYIFSTILLFYIVFKLYNKIDDQNKRINELVSELAIYHEKDEEDE